uniref:CCT domain-containing protein n=1 Tax=Populus davidiana TaxID=266767 RepID=A0A6M2FDH2_9ROSI
MIWVFLILQLLSDIVHDLIPLMDPAKCEAPAAVLKRNAAIGARIIKSMIGVDDDHGHTAQAKQSPVELSDSDPMTKQLGKEFWELQVANQLAITSNLEELLEGEEFESAPGIVDVTTESSDMNTEENAVEENSSEPEELESITRGNKEPFEASSEFANFSCENARGSLAEVSPVTSVRGEDFQCPQEVGTACDSSADDSYSTGIIVSSSQMAFSVVSSEKTVAEMELVSPRSSIFRESHSLPGNPLNNVTTKLISSSNPCNVAGHDSDSSTMLLSSTSAQSDSSLVLLSSTSAPTVSCKIKAAEMGLAASNSVLSLVSIDDSAVDDLTESKMENIDLSDNVKLEESCVIVDDNLLYEVARRNRKLRSYKKKIQDAFFAKKRLTKEYEQLAIWFGDLDDHDTMQRELSSSTTITLDPDPQTNSTQDSEWELL